ncbi:putative ferric-chelate reductase 1 isoform 2-T2 [Menidia menidia]
MWLRIVIGFTFISKLQGFGDGNFLESCASMSPDHTRGDTQLSPQTSEPPYEVTCQNGQPGEPITVSLRSIGAHYFRGFMLQAREVSYGAEGRTVGRYSSIETNTTRLLSCNGSTDSAVSHRNNKKKTSVNVAWTPQEEQELNIIFRATFAEDFVHFWERVNVTLAQCTTSPTMEPTSTQETKASTPTQETTASMSTPETTASTPTQETIVSMSTTSGCWLSITRSSSVLTLLSFSPLTIMTI